MDSFVEWRELNYMQLNTGKMNELVVDFSGWKIPPTPISIQRLNVKTMQDYMYHGVLL